MRSWTTFLVFGGIIAVLVLLFAVSRITNQRNPATQTAMNLLDAIAGDKLSVINDVLDMKTATVTTAGPKLASVHFKECTVGATGAFGHLSDIIWSAIEIRELVIDETRTPTITDDPTTGAGLAQVECKNGSKFLLRRSDADAPWRIFYIAKPDEKDKR
jgi:hypothetical protein